MTPAINYTKFSLCASTKLWHA